MDIYESDILKNKRIFISGGAGVIGTALVEKLNKMGNKIFVGDLKPRPEKFSENIIYRQGDLNFITKKEIEEFGVKVVILERNCPKEFEDISTSKIIKIVFKSEKT